MRKSNTTARRIFADNMRRVRKAKRLSQEALAELAELHRTYIGAVERGERNISIDNMERIALALGTSVHDLLNGRSSR